MKSAAFALIATIAAAQDDASSQTITLNDGTGINEKATSQTNIVVVAVPTISGTMVATQSVVYPNPSPNQIVQSWMCLHGAADDGENLYAISNATYSSDVSRPASIVSSKRCGAAPASMSALGSKTTISSLSTSSCSLNITQVFDQDGETFI
jgi:hypothetical protein